MLSNFLHDLTLWLCMWLGRTIIKSFASRSNRIDIGSLFVSQRKMCNKVNKVYIMTYFSSIITWFQKKLRSSRLSTSMKFGKQSLKLWVEYHSHKCLISSFTLWANDVVLGYTWHSFGRTQDVIFTFLPCFIRTEPNVWLLSIGKLSFISINFETEFFLSSPISKHLQKNPFSYTLTWWNGKSKTTEKKEHHEYFDSTT